MDPLLKLEKDKQTLTYLCKKILSPDNKNPNHQRKFIQKQSDCKINKIRSQLQLFENESRKLKQINHNQIKQTQQFHDLKARIMKQQSTQSQYKRICKKLKQQNQFLQKKLKQYQEKQKRMNQRLSKVIEKFRKQYKQFNYHQDLIVEIESYLIYLDRLIAQRQQRSQLQIRRYNKIGKEFDLLILKYKSLQKDKFQSQQKFQLIIKQKDLQMINVQRIETKLKADYQFEKQKLKKNYEFQLSKLKNKMVLKKEKRKLIKSELEEKNELIRKISQRNNQLQNQMYEFNLKINEFCNEQNRLNQLIQYQSTQSKLVNQENQNLKQRNFQLQNNYQVVKSQNQQLKQINTNLINTIQNYQQDNYQINNKFNQNYQQSQLIQLQCTKLQKSIQYHQQEIQHLKIENMELRHQNQEYRNAEIKNQDTILRLKQQKDKISSQYEQNIYQLKKKQMDERILNLELENKLRQTTIKGNNRGFQRIHKLKVIDELHSMIKNHKNSSNLY